MRVNPNQWSVMLNALDRASLSEDEAMREVATGRKLNQPSDDPAAMVLLIHNHDAQQCCEQYQQNISSLKSSFATADSALSAVMTSLTRAITLGVEGSSSTLSDSNRAAIAQELSAIQSGILSLANSTFNGSYIFAGTKTATQPFLEDATDPIGVSYRGDSITNQVPVAEGTTIASNKPGDTLFLATNVFGAMHALNNALQAGVGVDSATEQLRAAFDSLSAARVSYGTWLQQLQAGASFQADAKLQLQSDENSLAAVDLAGAISRLTNAENARSATLAAASQIGRNSLLDYLNSAF